MGGHVRTKRRGLSGPGDENFNEIPEVPMSCVVESKLLRLYATGQVLSIVTFFFIPIEGWLHALWQVGVGWAGATFVLVGMRRFRPEGKLAWYALSGGVFLNAAGLLVEMIGVRFFHITSAPGPAASTASIAVFMSPPTRAPDTCECSTVTDESAF